MSLPKLWLATNAWQSVILRQAFSTASRNIKRQITSGTGTKLHQQKQNQKHAYIQGQTPDGEEGKRKNIREYFYFIDHQGQLFLDDTRMKNFTSCFKDKQFLAFFFRQVKLNQTSRYTPHFPYVSMCGFERNFIRCDDCPIVYTHLIDDGHFLSMNHTGEKLKVRFNPPDICVLASSGRVYYPAAERYGGYGLVRDSIAMELSKLFVFGDQQQPTHIKWKEKTYKLNNDILPLIQRD